MLFAPETWSESFMTLGSILSEGRVHMYHLKPQISTAHSELTRPAAQCQYVHMYIRIRTCHRPPMSPNRICPPCKFYMECFGRMFGKKFRTMIFGRYRPFRLKLPKIHAAPAFHQIHFSTRQVAVL